MLTLVIIFSNLIILISIWLVKRVNYFKNFNVPHETINILFGHAKRSTLGEWSIVYDIDRIYTKFKGKGLCAGFMKNFIPYFLPLRAEVLKQILVTNFKNFRNNDFALDTENHSVISFNPFWLQNEQWKAKRSELSFAVTPMKLRALYPLIDESAKEFSRYIKSKMPTSTAFDLRDITLRYSCNSISNTSYGINAQAYDESSSEILDYGIRIWERIYTLTWLPTSPITRQVNQYFIKLMNKAVHRRHYNNEQRSDLLNYFIKLKDKKNYSEVESAAHAMVFFLDGFETSSVALCYILYELSRNQKVQQKLRKEINKHLNDADDQSLIPMDTLLNLPYLDQVFYEATRLHPPILYTTRVCTESFDLNVDDESLHIPNGTAVLIPIYSIHRDPTIYKNPDDFFPERFDEENGGIKAYRDRCELIPFGDGPRICLGKTYGTLQVKAAIVEILRHFELMCCDSVTEERAKPEPKKLSNVPIGKLAVEFRSLRNVDMNNNYVKN